MGYFKNWFYLYQNQTAPEKALESEVAAMGERYRVQHPFTTPRRIVDFALLDRQVVIEVDGASHQKPAQRYKDVVTTLVFEARGWAVVRISNEEALRGGGLQLALSRLATRPTPEELERERRRLLELHPSLAAPRARKRGPKKGPLPK